MEILLVIIIYDFILFWLGLYSVNYDPEKGMLRVSGNIDPEILINKFEKWGRKAELYSFQKDHKQIDNNKGKCRNCCSGNKKTEAVQIEDFDSSEENLEFYAPKKRSNNITMQNLKGSPKEDTPMKKQGAKKGTEFFGWFCKKDKTAASVAPKASTYNNGGANVPEKSPAASKWHFPRTSFPEYGVPGPFGAPPYSDPRLYYMNQYQPQMFPRPIRPYYGYGSMATSLPMPPQYGYFQPRPPPPLRMNPMIHYTNYRDNNLYYP